MTRPAYIVGGLLLVVLFYFMFMENVSKHVAISKNSDYITPSQWLIENHQKQAASRRSYMDKIASVSTQAGWGHLYNNLAPEVFCAEKIKVGTTDDGGKWMCSPQNLPDDCMIFALGISGVITFEEDIQRYSDQRCRIISVDSGQQSPGVIDALKKIRGVVIKGFVSNLDKDEKMTMETILKKNGATAVEILKIDIEGSEFTTMETFLSQYKPAQIMIEVHGDPAKTFNFIKMIASKGYYLFNYEINGQYHQLAEYAFIHESSMDRYGATLLAKYL